VNDCDWRFLAELSKKVDAEDGGGFWGWRFLDHAVAIFFSYRRLLSEGTPRPAE